LYEDFQVTDPLLATRRNTTGTCLPACPYAARRDRRAWSACFCGTISCSFWRGAAAGTWGLVEDKVLEAHALETGGEELSLATSPRGLLRDDPYPVFAPL